MNWGKARYTVIGMPQALVEAARACGTRRVAGELEATPVNLALTTAPVFAGTFVWAGASLLRRLGLEAGDPVTGHLYPVDPDYVLVPHDVQLALEAAGLGDAWGLMSPASRRRHLVPIDASATPATRARRVHALIESLSG